MTIVLGLAFALAGFVIGFGDGGRGAWSPYLSVLGGIVWLSAVIAAFATHGVKYGVLAVLASFVIAAVTMPVGRTAATKLRGR